MFLKTVSCGLDYNNYVKTDYQWKRHKRVDRSALNYFISTLTRKILEQVLKLRISKAKTIIVEQFI